MLALRRGAAVNSITAPLLSVLSETLANCRRRSEDVKWEIKILQNPYGGPNTMKLLDICQRSAI